MPSHSYWDATLSKKSIISCASYADAGYVELPLFSNKNIENNFVKFTKFVSSGTLLVEKELKGGQKDTKKYANGRN
jgi:hypothetical protein